MKKLVLLLFGIVMLLASCESDKPLKLYRVISGDNDTTFVNAYRWRIYGESSQYIIFDCGDRYNPVHAYVGNAKSIMPMEDE